MSCIKLLLLWAALLCCVSAQAGTNCSDPRIRKSWDAYNASEKSLYLEAIGRAMKSGYHQKFVELHTEFFSEKEAHQNCMFIYWHRLMLLGYENMLRSLGDKFQCITLPFWDHLAASARRSSGSCTSLESCSPILTALGGSYGSANAKYVSRNMVVYNVTIPYSSSSSVYNIQTLPLSNFTGNNSISGVVRGNTYRTAYPSEAYFASVYQQVFTYSDHASFTTSIERGVHNTIHSVVSGAMAYFQSPIDPIFYSHHALIDSLQMIYFKCQMGENVTLSATDKGSDPRIWSSCARRTSGYFAASDSIQMRVRAFNGSTWVNVWQEPKNMLYPFFKDVPHTFGEMADIRDLGYYSYTYQLSGNLANMYTNCIKSNTIDAAAAVLLAETKPDWRDTIGGCPDPVIKPGTADDDRAKRWNIALYEAARIVGYEEEAARQQMEMAMCQFQAECRDGVMDYMEPFRSNFNVEGHPRCYLIVEALKAQKIVIGIPNWRKITGRFLPCDKKGYKTSTTAEALE